jgi:hypothetical protein
VPLPDAKTPIFTGDPSTNKGEGIAGEIKQEVGSILVIFLSIQAFT